ncbi:hypothetical protein R1sor_002377 [Riccia sorocarpa]|uniref:Uncharacterized protein n=1 Tax=Riccia sorocarpa TaxID=122646 RepID=A0ABD3H223_9MARC
MSLTELPLSLPIASLKGVWGCTGQQELSAFLLLGGEARRKGLVLLEDISTPDNRLNLSLLILTIWDEVAHGAAMRQVESWFASVLLFDKKLWQIEGWYWRSEKEITRGWSLPNKDWTRLWWLEEPTYTDISVHWNVTADGVDWKQRWSRLWKGKALLRHKVLDKCLQLHHKQPSDLSLLSEHCRGSSLERNKNYFEGIKIPTSEWQTLGFTKVDSMVRWNMR